MRPSQSERGPGEAAGGGLAWGEQPRQSQGKGESEVSESPEAVPRVSWRPSRLSKAHVGSLVGWSRRKLVPYPAGQGMEGEAGGTGQQQSLLKGAWIGSPRLPKRPRKKSEGSEAKGKPKASSRRGAEAVPRVSGRAA